MQSHLTASELDCYKSIEGYVQEKMPENVSWKTSDIVFAFFYDSDMCLSISCRINTFDLPLARTVKVWFLAQVDS